MKFYLKKVVIVIKGEKNPNICFKLKNKSKIKEEKKNSSIGSSKILAFSHITFPCKCNLSLSLRKLSATTILYTNNPNNLFFSLPSTTTDLSSKP